jgi:hypothetical protein
MFGFAKKLAMRSKWLARRLWLIALFETGFITWRHWRRLEPDERERLVKLVRKSKGRPSNLSARERRQVDELLEKLGHVELLGNVAGTWLPFGWASRLATRLLGRRAKLGGRAGSEEALAAANGDGEAVGRGGEGADPARIV